MVHDIVPFDSYVPMIAMSICYMAFTIARDMQIP
jgi:hypothetical protein